MKEYTVITSRESSLRLWKVISTQEEQMKQKDIALVMWSEEEFACTRVLAKIHFNYMRLELCFSFLSHCCFCLLLFLLLFSFFCQQKCCWCPACATWRLEQCLVLFLSLHSEYAATYLHSFLKLFSCFLVCSV